MFKVTVAYSGPLKDGKQYHLVYDPHKQEVYLERAGEGETLWAWPFAEFPDFANQVRSVEKLMQAD